MNNWYYIENTEDDAQELLEMFWEFHDFRIQNINYNLEKDIIDLILEYDSDDLQVQLRFIHIYDFNFAPPGDYLADWLAGTILLITSSGAIMWISADDIEREDQVSKYDTWIKSKELHYAVIDEYGKPKEIPAIIIDQKGCALDFETKQYEHIEKHYSPKKLSEKTV